MGGFAGSGVPEGLLRALLSLGTGNLTFICQGAWPPPAENPDVVGIDQVVSSGLVRKMVAPMPFLPGQGGSGQGSNNQGSGNQATGGQPSAAETAWRNGSLEIEVVPQGVLAERLRAGGAGLGGVFVPAGAVPGGSGESRTISGVEHDFLPPLKADFALLKAAAADALGNLVYQGAQRNWNPVMAMAGAVTVVEADRIVEPGDLDPELVITPGIYVNRLVASV